MKFFDHTTVQNFCFFRINKTFLNVDIMSIEREMQQSGLWNKRNKENANNIHKQRTNDKFIRRIEIAKCLHCKCRSTHTFGISNNSSIENYRKY